MARKASDKVSVNTRVPAWVSTALDEIRWQERADTKSELAGDVLTQFVIERGFTPDTAAE